MACESLVNEVSWLWLICSPLLSFYYVYQSDKVQNFSHFVYALYSLRLKRSSVLRLTAGFVSKAECSTQVVPISITWGLFAGAN